MNSNLVSTAEAAVVQAPAKGGANGGAGGADGRADGGVTDGNNIGGAAADDCNCDLSQGGSPIWGLLVLALGLVPRRRRRG